MILTDFSSILHRMIYTSIKNTNPNKDESNKYITSEFINLTKYFIFTDLFGTVREFGNEYGELVICIDNGKDGYWRNDVYKSYKINRKKSKSTSDINFSEVFSEINEMIEHIQKYLPWKVVSVPRAEADDIMLILAREYNKNEKILILSPDKDMIQAQRNTNNVFQYSKLTKKWLKAETKAEDMDKWIQEHVCLGDACDEVPRVIDGTEFSSAFIKYLKKNNIKELTPYEFKKSDISNIKKRELLLNFDVYKYNKKGEKTELDIYKNNRFGPATLNKKINEYGCLQKWLDSHPLYREHYERNYTLVMEEGIPENISTDILITHKNAKSEYNNVKFEEYLNANSLKSLIMELPSIFKITHDLTADDFGW